MITQYNRDLEVGVTTNDVTLDDAMDGYQHNFTLHYIIACDVIAHVTTVTFGFGKRYRFKLMVATMSCFFLFR